MGRVDTINAAPLTDDWLTHAQLKVPDRLGGHEALFDHHGVARTGVLHLGGSVGEELETYIALGFRNILFVEPNPVQFEKLSAHVGFWQSWLDQLDRLSDSPRHVRIAAVCAAASDADGTSTLHLACDPGESSLCEPMPQFIETQGKVAVDTRRVDGLIATQGFDLKDFDVMVADVQGGELRAFQGAPALLANLRMIVTEVNYQPRYLQSASEPQVDRFLTDAGYRAVLQRRATPWVVAGDTVYVRGAKPEAVP